MRNLDTLAAQTAQEIVRGVIPQEDTDATKKAAALDNVATKTLGVLQENGVYAATLFLYSRSSTDAKIAPFVRTRLLGLAAHEVLNRPEPADQAPESLKFVTDHICNDLDTLLLVKQVWEQTLIYVRYGAKAREAKK
jgi:hypothetical protein